MNKDILTAFFETSSLREGLLAWYQFEQNDRVLEISESSKGRAEQLQSRCEYLLATLEETRTIDPSSIQPFDYILIIGELEVWGNGSYDRMEYANQLKRLQSYLKPSGKLLLAVENRFGLKYFCGTPDPYTDRAFDGLNKNPKGSQGHLFSRSELKEIIAIAGFPFSKFYYPLPDYKLPQLIYTDLHLPEKNLKERLIPYYTRNDTLVAYENELYDDVIENEVFPFVANSFFVEATIIKETQFCDVTYAAISTDRGQERAFVTSIHEEKFVTKCPLYKMGEESAKQLLSTMKELEKRGIPVVPHKLSEKYGNSCLEMPYIEFPTLSNYIKSIISKQPEKVIEIIDKLYLYILMSSDEVPDERRKSALGPILKKAYLELIPLNCFYNEADRNGGEFLFFDQEFIRENCPAKYVLFRAIYYIYCFTPNAEKYLPLAKLKERYEFGQNWEYYLQEELEFLSRVRNHKQYEQFYKMTEIDWKRIVDNADRLTSEEERIANYKVSDKMKKIWKTELDILDKVDELCRKHEITYFALHGTLLGAVRHKGFIPWDDDLDIGMLRSDYDRFLNVAKEELESPLFLETPESNCDMFWGGFTRVRNSDTTAIESKDMGHDGNHGIWIDILPIDETTQDEHLFMKKQKRIRHGQRLIYAKIYGKEYGQFMDMGGTMWRWYRFMSTFCTHSWLCRHLDKMMKLYPDVKSPYLSTFSGYYKHRMLNKKDFEGTTELKFAGRSLPVPSGYDNYLFMTLGRDYMKYPPEEDRKPKHDGIFDAEKAYSIYEEKLFNIFSDVKGKEIILFGAGMMFEDYMKKYGNRYKPSFIVDNDENKWGRSRMGISIKNPEVIKEIPISKRKIIICSYYYKEIERQLKEMGIQDYQVYVQELNWVMDAEKNE